MKSRECNGGNQPSVWQGRDGRLWFPTVKGVATISPELHRINQIPPPVLIERIKVDETEMSKIDDLKLSPGKKRFEIKYTAPSFLVSERVRFKYQLVDFDEDWIDAGTRRVAYYTNIPPGTYDFKVKACNSDGIWNHTGDSFRINFKPYLYQTWWFMLFILLCLILLAYLIHLLRLTKIRSQKDKLELIVARRTAELETMNNELKDFAHIVSHDLKAPLRGISQLAQWLIQDNYEKFNNEGKEQINLILNRVKRMYSLIDGILQYSRAGRTADSEETVDLNKIVDAVLELVDVPAGIRVTVENKLPTIYIGSTRIMQVFQNLIGNAVKYMDKVNGEINIGCKEEGKFHQFWVSDNGPGIDDKYHEKIFQIFQILVPRDERESTGVGLTVVKKIIEMYGGGVWIRSSKGEGSCFYFTLPVHK